VNSERTGRNALYAFSQRLIIFPATLAFHLDGFDLNFVPWIFLILIANCNMLSCVWWYAELAISKSWRALAVVALYLSITSQRAECFIHASAINWVLSAWSLLESLNGTCERTSLSNQ
jgi:hypothetical protein